MLLLLFRAAILPSFETPLNCKLLQRGCLCVLYGFLSNIVAGCPHAVGCVFSVALSVGVWEGPVVKLMEHVDITHVVDIDISVFASLQW